MPSNVYFSLLIVYVLFSIFGIQMIYNSIRQFVGQRAPAFKIFAKLSGPLMWFLAGLVFSLIFIPCA